MTEFRQTAASAGLIGLTALGGAAVGFVLQLLVAYYFGASANTDAYFMAISTSELLGKLLLGGSITAVFIPMFVARITRGQRHEAWHLALNIMHITSALFIIALLLIALFTEPFVRFIAPGFDAATTMLTVKLIRLLLPAFLFFFLVAFAAAILHSFKQFSLPAWVRVIAPAISIITIAAFAHTLGIFALALGTVLGSIAQLAFLLWGINRQGFSYRFIFSPSDPALKRLLYLVAPFIIAVLATQGAGIVYRILVSHLPEGSLTALKFAEKITQLLTIIFLSSITAVIYPTLSAKAAQRDFAGMRDTIASSIRLITLITIPLIIGVALLRHPLVALVYQHGSFDAAAASATSVALLFLILGLTINGIGSVLGHATLALQKTRASVAVSVASQIVAIVLFLILVPRLNLAGLALTASLVPIVIAGLYFWYLARFLPNLGRVFVHRSYLKITALAIILYLAILFPYRVILTLPLPSGLGTLAQLLIPTALGASLYFGGAWLWKIPEMEVLITIAKNKFSRRP